MRLCVFFIFLTAGLFAEDGIERWKVEPQLNYFENLIGRKITNVKLTDINGQESTLYKEGGKGTLIAVFDVDCPMSLRLAPKLQRLESELNGLDMRHLIISKQASKEEARKTYDQRKFKRALLIDDKNQSAARALNVKTTCEIFLVDGAGTLIYRGAVDDQYGIGFVKEKPQNNFLADAISSFVKKEPVEIKLTTAPGCMIELEKKEAAKSEVTFHKDISRLLQNHCQRCHHDGGVGPFTLITYDEVKERRKMIKYVVDKKLMPPWFAHGGGPWEDNYNLEEAERKMIIDWVAAGAPEGDKKDAPLPREWPKKWLLEDPDLVVPLDRKIAVKAEGFMRYENVFVKVPTKEDKWISGVEIRTQNPQVLHHVLVFHIGPDRTKKVDTSGVRGFFAGYVPGNQANIYPESTGKKLEAGTWLKFQLHYTPNGTAVMDQISIAFKFHDKKPKNIIETRSAFNTRFLIPPRTDNFRVEAKHRFLEDGLIVGFNPHAHLRGKAFAYDLVSRDGKRKRLLDIPKYDFNWQITYQYQNPLKVKAGDMLEVTALYDNTSNNPANPDPNKRVRFGDQTHDEMMIGYFEWISTPKDDTIFMPDELKKEVNSLLAQIEAKDMNKQQAGRKLFQFLMGQVKSQKMSQQEAMEYFRVIAEKYGDKNQN